MTVPITRRNFVALAAGLVGTAALSGCDLEGVTSATSTTTTGEAATVNLRVGAQPFSLYSNVLLAHKRGYLSEELGKVGATYTWDVFKSGPLVNEAVAGGNEDCGFMADLPAIIAKSTGQDIRIVTNLAYGERALAVLVKPDATYQSVADLKGAKVAYATGSYAQHLLALLLDKEGLTLKDVDSINLGADDQVAALQEGQVEAIVIWEQYISKLTDEGQARVLADGTGIKRGNMITYFTSSFVKEHPEVIEAYIAAVNRADNDLASDPDAAAEELAQDFGLSKEVTLKMWNNLEFTSKLENVDVDAIAEVSDFALKSGIIKSEVNVDDLVDTSLSDKVNA